MIRSLEVYAIVFAAIAVTLRADTRRRRLSLICSRGWKLFTALDIAAVAATIAFAATVIGGSSVLLESGCAILVLLFLWSEGKRQVQLQRPAGIVFAEWCILAGAYWAFVLHANLGAHLKFAPVVAGVVLVGVLIPSFVQGQEEYRVLNQIHTYGEFVQEEWASPTRECPFPSQWKMLDAQSAEIEVLDFLKALVTTVKPDLIVETGTFVGHSAIKMAEGLKENGFGKIVTVERDPTVFMKAHRNIIDSGFGQWIDARCGSSLELEVRGTIDMLYSDSALEIRESEVRRFLPQVKPGGLVLMHDASSSFHVVREAALRMEREGLLSVLLLPTPRGLVVAQKVEGRT
jgi:predicted O-methyltransferase YrrM